MELNFLILKLFEREIWRSGNFENVICQTWNVAQETWLLSIKFLGWIIISVRVTICRVTTRLTVTRMNAIQSQKWVVSNQMFIVMSSFRLRIRLELTSPQRYVIFNIGHESSHNVLHARTIHIRFHWCNITFVQHFCLMKLWFIPLKLFGPDRLRQNIHFYFNFFVFFILCSNKFFQWKNRISDFYLNIERNLSIISFAINWKTVFY